MVHPKPPARFRSSRLIVCEKSGHWAAWLRRLGDDQGRWVVETRSLAQLERQLAEHPAGLCCLEVHRQNVIAVLRAVAEIRQRRPAAQCVVCCDRDTRHFEINFREAGAAGVLNSPRQADAIWRMWRRHGRRFPPREETLMDRVLAQLPW